MSTVVHCTCARSGLPVAIKMYHKERMNSLNVRQVAREIEIHASMLHPNVANLYAAFEDGDGIYLVQELATRGARALPCRAPFVGNPASGRHRPPRQHAPCAAPLAPPLPSQPCLLRHAGDLYAELSRHGGYMLEAHVVKHVMAPFLSALCYLHARAVLHRDIKPENILLSGEGEIKVADFGLAIDTGREKPMSRVGTLDYMPPEVRAGERPRRDSCVTAPAAALILHL